MSEGVNAVFAHRRAIESMEASIQSKYMERGGTGSVLEFLDTNPNQLPPDLLELWHDMVTIHLIGLESAYGLLDPEEG